MQFQNEINANNTSSSSSSSSNNISSSFAPNNENTLSIDIPVSRINRRNDNRCNECNKTFTRAANYRAHMISHLPREQWPFKCSICPKKFPRLDKLNLHTNTVHENQRSYAC